MERYKSFDDIPDKPELDRITALAAQATRRLRYGGTLEDLSEDEWAALAVMQPDTVERLHVTHRKAMAQPPSAPITTAAPTGVVLAHYQADEPIETFWTRCRKMAAPVYMVRAVQDALMQHITQFVEAVNVKNLERNEKIAALEARVTAIEDRGLDYKGVFEPGETYRRGDCVTQDGHMWIAKTRPNGRPGVDFDGWQLAVSRGRDGRRAR